MILICEKDGCFNSFVKKNRKHRFCSTTCAYSGVCELCNSEFTKKHTKQRFCSSNCSNKYSTDLKENGEEYENYRTNRADIMRKVNQDRLGSLEWSTKIGQTVKAKSEKPTPSNIFQCSSRTRRKIIKRLDVKCCVCGWKEGSCDIHHISGRAIDDCHNHNNLTILCPNHHRLYHEGKVSRDSIKTFEQQFGDLWLQHYFNFRSVG